MKVSAILVNISCGPVIDETPPFDHYRNNPEFKATLDLFKNEPRLAPELSELDNVDVVPQSIGHQLGPGGDGRSGGDQCCGNLCLVNMVAVEAIIRVLYQENRAPSGTMEYKRRIPHLVVRLYRF